MRHLSLAAIEQVLLMWPSNLDRTQDRLYLRYRSVWRMVLLKLTYLSFGGLEFQINSLAETFPLQSFVYPASQAFRRDGE